MKKQKQVKKILNDFLKSFKCNAGAGDEFAYILNNHHITYVPRIIEKDNDDFIKNFKNFYPEINFNDFIISFFHELGHHMTRKKFNSKDWKKYKKVVKQIATNEEYFTLEIERAATKWAAKYITKHYKKVKKLEEKITPLLKDYISNP